MDYKKWDNIEDSDEEREGRSQIVPEHDTHDVELRKGMQERIDDWLRRQLYTLNREEAKEKDEAPLRYRNPEAYAMREERKAMKPIRKLTKEERKTLSMLIAISDFREGETNLIRHPQMLDLVRHNRWLEEDPGTLELLCRVHNRNLRAPKEGQAIPKETPLDVEMRAKVMCGINTIAAPKGTKCPGGLLEMITLICTPETDAAREWRRKWQAKDFAKDAILESLFPEYSKGSGGDEDDSMWEVWVLLGFLIILVLGMVYLAVYGWPFGPLGGRAAGKGAKAAAKAAAAVAKGVAASADGAAAVTVAGAGEAAAVNVASAAAAGAGMAAMAPEKPGATEL